MGSEIDFFYWAGELQALHGVGNWISGNWLASEGRTVERHLCSAGEIASDHFPFGPWIEAKCGSACPAVAQPPPRSLRSDTGLSVTKWPWASSCRFKQQSSCALGFRAAERRRYGGIYLQFLDISYSLEKLDNYEKLYRLQLRPPISGLCRMRRKRVAVACSHNKTAQPRFASFGRPLAMARLASLQLD